MVLFTPHPEGVRAVQGSKQDLYSPTMGNKRKPHKINVFSLLPHSPTTFMKGEGVSKQGGVSKRREGISLIERQIRLTFLSYQADSGGFENAELGTIFTADIKGTIPTADAAEPGRSGEPEGTGKA